jgi:hypothetical protein
VEKKSPVPLYDIGSDPRMVAENQPSGTGAACSVEQEVTSRMLSTRPKREV